MATLAFQVPLLPGKTERWLAFAKEVSGPRRVACVDSRRALGLKRERAWLQRGLDGDTVVVVFEGDDPARSLEGMGTSMRPFDVWFREQVMDLHGLDLANPPVHPPSVLTFEINSGPVYEEQPSA